MMYPRLSRKRQERKTDEPTESNCAKCRKALSAFGYDVTDISIDDLFTKKVLVRDYTVETDIHPFVKGVSFNTVGKNKVRRRFGDIYVWFASLNDLIKMKKAAGRTKDREDLKYLQALKNKLQKKSSNE